MRSRKDKWQKEDTAVVVGGRWWYSRWWEKNTVCPSFFDIDLHKYFYCTVPACWLIFLSSTRKNNQNLVNPQRQFRFLYVSFMFPYVSLRFLYHNRSCSTWFSLSWWLKNRTKKKLITHVPPENSWRIWDFTPNHKTKRLDWSREVQWLHASGESAR